MNDIDSLWVIIPLLIISLAGCGLYCFINPEHPSNYPQDENDEY